MITLQDILTKDPDEIINSIIVIKEAKVLPAIPDNDIEIIKTSLAGFLKGEPSLLELGQVLHVANYFITVKRILKSSGRVFFSINDFNKEFSVQISYLIGEEPTEFPFKKGDQVKLNNDIWIVKSINPASRNVVILHNSLGIKRISIDKVEKL